MPGLNSFSWPSGAEVHVHSTTFSSCSSRSLSPDESRRADQLVDPNQRKRFIAGRGFLRETLGTYLQLPPGEIRLETGAHGKPRLADSRCNAPFLHFNVSHSGPLILLAIAVDHEIGIDVEQITTDAPINDMARLAFSLREQKELSVLHGIDQLKAFYRCWTRKEAFLKATGKGFALPSNSFDMSLQPAATVPCNCPETDALWHLHQVSVPGGFCAALAISEIAPTIQYISY